ncbi:MAG: hypothetical protein KAH99_00505, partial [Verrucomicrobia bacterium]|nr:hypothetical protein [Verrucomicrobiota bacterium]
EFLMLAQMAGEQPVGRSSFLDNQAGYFGKKFSKHIRMAPHYFLGKGFWFGLVVHKIVFLGCTRVPRQVFKGFIT